MTHMEAMAAIAQGVINIDAADTGAAGNLNVIEKGSLIYRGMLTIVREEERTIAALREIIRLLAAPTPRKGASAREIAMRLLADREVTT